MSSFTVSTGSLDTSNGSVSVETMKVSSAIFNTMTLLGRRFRKHTMSSFGRWLKMSTGLLSHLVDLQGM